MSFFNSPPNDKKSDTNVFQIGAKWDRAIEIGKKRKKNIQFRVKSVEKWERDGKGE
jgi:hypothetical protein